MFSFFHLRFWFQIQFWLESAQQITQPLSLSREISGLVLPVLFFVVICSILSTIIVGICFGYWGILCAQVIAKAYEFAVYLLWYEIPKLLLKLMQDNSRMWIACN